MNLIKTWLPKLGLVLCLHLVSQSNVLVAETKIGQKSGTPPVLVSDSSSITVYFHLEAGTGWDPNSIYGNFVIPFSHMMGTSPQTDGSITFQVINGEVKNAGGGSQGANGVYSVAYGKFTNSVSTDTRILSGKGYFYKTIGGVPVNMGSTSRWEATLKWEPVIGNVDVPDYRLDVYMTVNNGFEECSCDCRGSEEVRNSSVDFAVNLGEDALGRSSVITCKAEYPAPELSTPSALAINVLPDTEVIRWNGTTGGATGLLRQVKTPSMLADIVVIDAKEYQIRLYNLADIGAKSNGLYTINGGAAPQRTYVVENPDVGSDYNKLNFSKVVGASTTTYEYEYDSGTSAWTLTRPDATEEVVTSVYNGAQTERTLTRTYKNSGGTTVKVEREVFATDTWGMWRKVQHILDPDGANLITEYEYYNNTSVPATFGKPKRTKEWNGSWEYWEYDSMGRITKRVRPFGVSSPTDADSLNDVTTYAYSTPTGSWRRETATRTVLGQAISTTYTDRLYSSGVLQKENVIQAIAAGAAATATGNLITERTYVTSGTFKDKLASEIRPDGTGTFITYSLTSGIVETITYNGQHNAGKTAVTNGTKTTTQSNSSGEVLSEEVKDWVSSAAGITISSKTGSNADPFGRYQTMTYADGTTELFEYGCCGLEAQTDRLGIETVYQRDFRQRTTLETRAGVQIAYTYDAGGNVKTVLRGPEGGSLSTIETNDYNVAGQKIWTKDALNNQTSFAESYNPTTGLLTRTTTYPDTVSTGDTTRIEKYARDRQMIELAGTAVRPMKHECGVESEGGAYRLFCKDIQIGESGAETEWAKTYKDALGRDYKVLLAGSGSPAITRFYDTQGRLNKQVDPDGVTTLFGYNNLGEQETVAIEASGGNSTIDLAGTDRIRKTAVTYGNVTFDGSSHPARITTVSEWATDGTNSPVEVQKSEQSLNSLHQKQTSYGLVTEFKYNSMPSVGAWSTTTKSPDNSTVTETYANGRLHVREQNDSNGTRLGKTTHTYDTLGRLSSTEDVRNGATTYTYTTLDQILTVTTPVPGPGQPAQVTGYEYTPGGKLKKEILPDSSETNHEYWPTGDLKRSYGSQTYDVSYTYTPQGRMKTMVTSSGTTTWHYDSARGFLSSKEDAAAKSVTYTYKPSGRLWTRTWARGVITTYSYNGFGDLAGVDYSDSTPDVTYTTYDRRGRNTGVTDAAGTWTLAYNAAGELTSETVAGGILDGASVARGYDSLLRRNSLTTSLNSATLQSIGYIYDPYVSRLKEVNDGSVNKSTYSYVTDSTLVDTLTHTRTTTDVMFTKKEYDFLNRLTSITSRKSNDNSILTKYAYQYNSLNQRTRATTADNSYWSYGYDGLGQVTTGKRYWSNDTSVPGQDYGYDFDGIGNRETTETNGRTSTYTNNSVNEIEQRTVPGALDILGQAHADATVTVNNQQAERGENGYFYKELTVNNAAAPVWQSVSITGARTSVPPGSPDAITQQSGNLYLQKTPEVFGYDDDGNMESDGRWNIAWDAENRAISFEAISTVPSAAKKKIECKYDSVGRRIEKKLYAWNTGTSGYDLAATIQFVYDGWNLIAELDGSGNLIRTYRWGLDLSDSMRGAGGVGGLLSVTVHGTTAKTYVPNYDGNGNIVKNIDAADSSIAAEFEHGPFGELLKAAGPAVNDCLFRFSTKYWDPEMGYYYYSYRFYNPNLGRWISRDPIGEIGGDNLLNFLDNDPIDMVDSSGLAPYVWTFKHQVFYLPSWKSLKGDVDHTVHGVTRLYTSVWPVCRCVDNDPNKWMFHYFGVQNDLQVYILNEEGYKKREPRARQPWNQWAQGVLDDETDHVVDDWNWIQTEAKKIVQKFDNPMLHFTYKSREDCMAQTRKAADALEEDILLWSYLGAKHASINYWDTSGAHVILPSGRRETEKPPRPPMAPEGPNIYPK